MALWQMHHQFQDGQTECKAQRNISSQDELTQFVRECVDEFPLPEGANWLAVEEASPLFVLEYKPKG